MNGRRSARSAGSRSTAPVHVEADLDDATDDGPGDWAQTLAGTASASSAAAPSSTPATTASSTSAEKSSDKSPDRPAETSSEKTAQKSRSTTSERSSAKVAADPADAPDEDTAELLRPRRRSTSRRRFWTGALTAVAALLAGGGLAAWGVVQTDHARKAQDLADLSLAIAADPDAKRATATVATGGSVTLVVSGTRAALVARDLLILDSQHAYQVWLVRDNVVTPATLGPTGTAAGAPWVRVVTAVQPGDTIAISQEPAQGSTRPTGKPIAALKL